MYTIEVNGVERPINERAFEKLSALDVLPHDCPAIRDGWFCTRSLGHVGPHVAHGSRPRVVWFDAPKRGYVANAQVWGAARDLLAALEAFVAEVTSTDFEMTDGERAALGLALPAIAKAKGE